MIEIPAILKAINAQGIAGIVVALVLGSVLVVQGCSKHDIRTERDAFERLYKEQLNETMAWQLNAKSWMDAAQKCAAQTRAMREASAEAQADLLRELRAARAGRRVSELELQRLREEIERGEITIYELLRRVQGV